MIVISYWELNPAVNALDTAKAGQAVMSSGQWPPEGCKIMSWYVSASDHWGITILEVDSEEAMAKYAHAWTLTLPGMFKKIKSTIALKAEEAMPMLAQFAQTLKGE